MSRVLLIRPLEDALPMMAILKAKNMEYSHYPLFQPHFLPISTLENPQALIITSKNAIRALKDQEELKKTLLYVVGDKTADLAQQLGFLNVLSSSGTNKELVKLILTTAKRDRGILWHLSGATVKGNIIDILKNAGFEAKRKIVYFIEDADDFSLSLYNELKNQQISHVIFCSPRTTSLFIKLLKKKKLEKIACQIISLCLSQDVKEKALDLKWKKLWVSPQPNIQSLVRYFDE